MAKSYCCTEPAFLTLRKTPSSLHHRESPVTETVLGICREEPPVTTPATVHEFGMESNHEYRADLARRSGVSPATVFAILGGKWPINIRHAGARAKWFGSQRETFLGECR